jgi:hypothetical protein
VELSFPKKANMEKVIKFEGTEVKLGDKTFVVPALTIGQARRLWPEILEMNDGITAANLPDKQSKWMDIVHAALSRNYPDLKREELEELVDLRSIKKLMMIVMGNSEMPLNRGEAAPVVGSLVQ